MADGRLQGRVAIVTGGTSGLGAAGARLFAREGAQVIVAALESPDVEAVVEDIREGAGSVDFIATDVTDPRACEALVAETLARFDRLDIAYSNAGVQVVGTAAETSDEEWSRSVAVNLSGQFYLARAALPALAAGEGGSLILTASEFGLVGTSASVAYCAAKGGVVNMTRALAVDSAGSGVRVNCLCPGPADTPMIRGWFAEADDPAALEQAQVAPVLLQRLGRPEEIAAAALFLASPESSFMTGSIMVVDGGATSWYGL